MSAIIHKAVRTFLYYPTTFIVISRAGRSRQMPCPLAAPPRRRVV